MELNKTFTSHDWRIKYNLFEPEKKGSISRRTLVFVHGTPWSSDVFLPIARSLLARGSYRILLYDLPGYGQSQDRTQAENTSSDESTFQGETSVATQAVILAELLELLHMDGKEDREAPAIIAHDIAGTIALRTHLIHKCNFGSLLLLDTNTVLPWGDGFYKLVRSKPDVFLELPPAIFEAMVGAVIRSACYNPKVLGSGWEDALARPWIAAEDDDSAEASKKQSSFVRQIAQANDADVQEMLDGEMYSSVGCDVKIIWGEYDQWIPYEKMDRLAGMLGDRLKDFVVVPEAGHLVMLDQPERVSVEIFDWLEEQK